MAASRFATFLESLNADPQKRGTQWEHVCKWFLETDPVYRSQLKNVWLWKQWPGKWGPDAGIDLVAEAKDGTLWAVQAKAYAPDNAVTKTDMDSFLSESARVEFDHRLLLRPPSAARWRLSLSRRRTLKCGAFMWWRRCTELSYHPQSSNQGDAPWPGTLTVS